MGAIMDGDATPAQIGALLAAMAARGETEDEVTGFARTMRARAVPLTSKGAVDTCGTGGDGAGTFNISTVASFVVAACGAPVAKHGNRSASGTCGSADVLEALGIRIDAPTATVQKALDEVGWTFLFAPALPRRDPPRGRAAQGDGRAHRLQPARPAHEPGAAGGPGGRRAEAGAHGLRRALPAAARDEAGLGRERQRARRADARRAHDRRRGGRRDGPELHDRAGGRRPRGVAARVAPRRGPAGERGDRARRARGRPGAEARRGAAERRRGARGGRARPRTSATASGSPPRPSTTARARALVDRVREALA